MEVKLDFKVGKEVRPTLLRSAQQLEQIDRLLQNRALLQATTPRPPRFSRKPLPADTPPPAAVQAYMKQGLLGRLRDWGSFKFHSVFGIDLFRQTKRAVGNTGLADLHPLEGIKGAAQAVVHEVQTNNAKAFNKAVRGISGVMFGYKPDEVVPIDHHAEAERKAALKQAAQGFSQFMDTTFTPRQILKVGKAVGQDLSRDAAQPFRFAGQAISFKAEELKNRAAQKIDGAVLTGRVIKQNALLDLAQFFASKAQDSHLALPKQP